MSTPSSHAISPSGAGEKKKLRMPSASERTMTLEIYFLDYWWDLLTYLHQRKNRLEMFKSRAEGMSEDTKAKDWELLCEKESRYLRKRRTRLKFGDFEIMIQIGKGGYGEVFLSRKRDTNEIVALKRMRKNALQAQDEVHHILNERNVLCSTDSQWLVRLLYSFQDEQHVYLAMEYVAGGDMRTLLNGSGVLHEHHARFYMMEMVLCVATLHSMGFIHRDLKPENFLIDAHGHMKLTDFGLAKGVVSSEYREKMNKRLLQIKDKSIVKYSSMERRSMYQSIRKEDRAMAFSLVGSPDYMAPEMLTQQGYDLLVDYWSIGCIFFEFLSAFPPFGAPTIDEIWVNVYHWKEVLERPLYSGDDAEFNMSEEAWDLITKLIADKSERWASPSAIQDHRWFKGANWDSVRDMEPPFKPELADECDTTYFDDFTNPEDLAKYGEFEKSEVAEPPQELEGGLGGPHNKWVGWTYRSQDKRFGHFDGSSLRGFL